MSKFFCLPNLATDHVSVSSEPWNEFPVSGETLALPKDEYKKRWFTPDTRHCLFSLCEGQNGAFVVSQGNQCSMVHGFAADFDGVFTPDVNNNWTFNTGDYAAFDTAGPITVGSQSWPLPSGDGFQVVVADPISLEGSSSFFAMMCGT